MPDSSKMRR